MAEPLKYVDLGMRQISLADLDKEERQLVRRLQRRAREYPDWNDFENYSLKAVARFYEARGFSRKEVIQTAAWRIAQDLCGRLGIAAGLVRPPDFGGELTEVVYLRFNSLHAFCEATGMAEDLVQDYLYGRKPLEVDTLCEALDRIGYTLRILPVDQEIAPERNGTARRTGKKTRAPRKAAKSSRS